MSGSPTISVVIPAYNAARYLYGSIQSVLAQTFGDFECIVVDDGSTDATPNLLAGLAREDKRVVLLRLAHGGIVAALNAGIAAARAGLIARMDADDLCVPERFALQLAYLNEHPEVVALGAQVLTVDPYGSPLWETDQKPGHEQIVSSLLRGNGLALCHPAVMMRKSAVLAAGGYATEYQWVEDLDLFLRMSEIGKLANLPNVLLHYRQHFGSVNKHRVQLQESIKERLVAEAHRRLGLAVPGPGQIERAQQLAPLEQLRIWTGQALRQGNLKIARRHAMAAIRLAPLRKDAWWLMYHSLRGRHWKAQRGTAGELPAVA